MAHFAPYFSLSAAFFKLVPGQDTLTEKERDRPYGAQTDQRVNNTADYAHASENERNQVEVEQADKTPVETADY